MNLNLVPVPQQPLTVVALLRQSGAVVADGAIQTLADKHGDQVALSLIKKLPAMAVADIVREFDYTKPSIVGSLMTPRQLRKVVERLPLFGGSGTIEATLCAVILQREETERGAYFREIAKSEIGLIALSLAFPEDTLMLYATTGKFGEDEEPVTLHDVRMGEWEELLFSLRTLSPQVFNRAVRTVHLARSAKPRRDLTAELKEHVRRVFGTTAETRDPYADFL